METKYPELFKYGIQNEQSDIRVHVCPIAKKVYVYPTIEGRNACESGIFPTRFGYQKGVEYPTGNGYTIPPQKIKRCVCVSVNDAVWDHINFNLDESTTEKGKKAVRLVSAMIVNGILPIPRNIRSFDDDPVLSLQIKGDDIIVDFKADRVLIQVKCDFRGGEGQGTTGNLYLQIAELNPLRMK
jgi:hypothetical protein